VTASSSEGVVSDIGAPEPQSEPIDLPPPSASDDAPRSEAPRAVSKPEPRPRVQALIDGLASFATTGVSLAAGLAVAIEVATRAVAPCLRGLAIGLDAWINRAALLQDILSLTLMIAVFAVGALQVTTLASSRTPLLLRGLAMLGTGVALLVMLAAPSADHPPLGLLVASAASCSTLALLVAASGIGDRTFRLPAIAAFGVAVGTMARTASVFLAARAAEGPKSEGLEPARVLATVGFGADMLILLAVAVWAASRSRRIALPLVAGALTLAILGARWTVTSPDDTSVLAMLVRLGARMMMSRPVPLVPYYLEIFGILFAFLLATVVLFIPKQMRPVAGALAMFAVVRSSGEVPIHASLIGVGCVGLLLTQFSPKSFWAGIPDAAPMSARRS
jgi:hypothetical protein